MKIRFSLVWLVVLGSCQVGPKHCPPDTCIEQDWVGATEEFDRESEPLPLSELLKDPLLDCYLRQLVCENYDIQKAYASVQEAYAMRRISAAHLFPEIDGQIGYSRAKPAGGILFGEDDPAFQAIPLNIKQQTFLAQFDVAWEIDLFGKRKNELAAAEAYMESQCASYRFVILSLTSEFARLYLELRRNQKMVELVREELGILKEKTGISEERLDYGLDPETPSLESEGTYEKLKADIAFYEGEVLHLMYRLSVLLGSKPNTLVAELEKDSEIPSVKEVIPIGFPSELLRRRPDIQQAEKELAQATAEVGVAVAELFPSFSLMGNYGFQNLHLGDTKGEGPSWGYGMNFLAPLFHAGSLQANVDRAWWIKYQALLNYQQTVLDALEESETAIIRVQKRTQSEADRKNAYKSYFEVYLQEKSRVEQGLTNQLQLLDKQKKALEIEMEWMNAKVDQRIQLIALYKALGGPFC